MSWNHGYNTDLGYTYGYYRELDPAWLDLCALLRGAAPPRLVAKGTLRYLELGCGQGFNLCLMAACHPGMEFVGIDFNPQHIAHAQKLATAAGLTNVRFVEASFTDLAPAWPDELGRFHYAAAHGILSWISRPVREGLYACLDAALLPGGLVYCSYNALPGWLSAQPVQHLMRLWQTREGLSSAQTIEVARQRLEELHGANAAMCRVLPALKTRIDQLGQHDRSYLVNEYLHEEWTTFWFDELAAETAPHKLVYLGTATAGDWYLPAMLPAEWKSILAQYPDLVARETMLDVLVNQSFRRDLWIKGHTPLWAEEQRQALLSQRFVLLSRPQPKDDGANPFAYATSLGEVTGKTEVYAPLYDALASGPKTLAELLTVPTAAPSPETLTIAAPTAPARTLGDTLQALGLMLHAGHIALARKLDTDKPAKALNRAIAGAVLAGAPYTYAVATGIPWVLRASDGDLMLAALHLATPKASPAELAAAWVDRLLALGRGLAKDGQALTAREAMLPRAEELAQAFVTSTLPQWQRLGVL